jgi:carbamate kinase
LGPKVEAARRFVSRPGRQGALAAIGALEDAARIVADEAGTRIAQAGPGPSA